MAALALFAVSCDLFGPPAPTEDPVDDPGTGTLSSDATLASLALSVGELAPAFSADVLSYGATVPAETESFTVSASPSNPGATVSGTGSVAFGAGIDGTTVSVTVTAADGVTWKTYTIDIVRDAGAPSGEARLARLNVEYSGIPVMLTPAFNPGIDIYSASYSIGDGVPHDAALLRITATAWDSGAIVDGAGDWNLAPGLNSRALTVTAADGVTEKTYTVYITLPESGQDNCELSTLLLEGYDLGFSERDASYALTVPAATSSVRLSATPRFSGTTVQYSYDGSEPSLDYTGAVDIPVGPAGTDKLIRVRARSESGTSREYGIAVHVASEGASAIATLESLVMYDEGDVPIELTPAFAPGIFAYTAAVPSLTTNLGSTAFTTTDAGASVNAPDRVELSVGDNPLTVTVSAPDGIATETYTINVIRAAPPVLTIAAPAGSIVDTASFTVSGTCFDPNGEIASVIFTFDWASGAGTAIPDVSGGFSAELGTAGLANGPNALTAIARDSSGSWLTMDTVGFDFPSGAATHAVTCTVDLAPGSAFTDGYLMVSPSTGGFGSVLGYRAGIPVSPSDFPYTLTLDGVPAGEYMLLAMITATPDVQAGTMFRSDDTVMVTVVDADLTVPTTVMMYATAP